MKRILAARWAWLVLAAAFGVPAAAVGQTPMLAPAPDAKPTLDAAFKMYCAKEGTTARYCRLPVPPGVEWLVLNTICPAEGLSGRPSCDMFQKVRTKFVPTVLAFNHETAAWTLTQKGSGFARLTLDANGTPTVFSSASKNLVAIVSHTNPLLYRVTLKPVTATPIASLADLTTVVNGFGSVLQGSISLIGKNHDFDLLASDPLKDYEAKVLGTLKEIEATRTALRDQLRLDTLASRAFTTCAQHIEFGTATTCANIPAPGAKAAPLEPALDALDEKITDLRNRYEPCAPVFHAFSDFVVAATGTAAQIKTAEGRSLKFAALAVSTCASELPLVDNLATLAGKLRDKVAEGNATTDDPAIAAGLRLTALDPSSETGSLAQGQKVLEKRNDLLKASYAAREASGRLLDFSIPDAKILDWFWIEIPTGETTWENVYTYGFAISADTAYKDSITSSSSKGDETTGYKVASPHADALGVGVSVVYSPLAEATWGAVDDPAAEGKKVIGKTDSTKRAGQVALFADYKFVPLIFSRASGWSVKPLLQFGTGLSTTPQIYVGAGLEFFKVFRLSTGWTYQRFKVLDGQTEGMSISGSDAIKRRDEFSGGRYVAFSFALDSISLFTKAK